MSHFEKRLPSDSGLPTREELFNYTDSEALEYNHSMFGAIGSPKQGNPWSFIDVINPKKHALAFARELDTKRGIPPEKNKEADGCDSGRASDELSSQSTIRRLPSGAKPTSTGHTIQATTPVKPNGDDSKNPTEQNLSDMVGQSTPLTLAKAPPVEKRFSSSSDSEQRVKDYEGLLKETEWLHQEIAQLKDQLLHSESQQMAKDGKITELKKALEEKVSTIDLLSASLQKKEDGINSLNADLQKFRERLEATEDNRLADNKRNEAELKKMTDNLEEKMKVIDEMEAKRQKMLQSNSKAVEDLKKCHEEEKEALSLKLKKLDTNWHENLEKEKQKLLCDIDSLEAEYDAKNSELQNAITKKTDEAHEFKRRLQKSDNEMAAKIKELEAMQVKLKEKDKELENRVEQMGNLNDKLHEINEALASKVKEVETLEMASKEKDEKLAQKSKDSEKLESHLKQKNEDLSEKDKRINLLQNSLKGKEEEHAIKSRNLITLEEKLAQKEDELAKKSKEFDLTLESKKELIKVQSGLEQDLQSLRLQIRKLEGQIKKLEERLSRQQSDSDSLKKSYQVEKERNDKLMNKLRDVDRFAEYIENLELFEKKMGSLIVETFQKNHEMTSLDPFFLNSFKDITGFHTKHHEEVSQGMQNKIDSLELKNQELIMQIEHQWKSKLDKAHQDLQQQKQLLDQEQERLRMTDDRLATAQAKLDIYQEEKAVLLKEKEAVLQNNVTLSEEITNYKSDCFDKEQENFLELVQKIESLSDTIYKLQEETKIAHKASDDLEHCLKDKEEQLKELQTLYDSQLSELQNSRDTLRKLQGDPSRKITFEVARRSRPDINATTYSHLMVNKVDSIDMVELQNIVKNIILLLDIPFNKLTKKSPLVAIYLKYERPIFSHFANRLHFQLFNEVIDLKRFSNEAYEQYTEDHDMGAIKHPLQICLDNLYQKLVPRL